ncbi:MAG: alpha/beta hydrolase [Candidatus Aminicenantes bacterium]|nr:MAG: alpha/beta hydrolase [Candidatus Aminicenantes bacterium]
MKPLKVSIAIFTVILAIIFTVNMQAKAIKMASADGLPIVYQVQGKGDVALVLVHCWCCDKSFWELQVPVFARHYQVVTLDLGGHGESGQDRKDWTMEAFGLDVAAVVKKLALKKVILIGHSMGGTVAVEAARLLSRQVIGLIAVDTLQNVEQKFTKEQYEQLTAPMRKDFKTGAEKFLRAWMFTPKTDPALIDKIVKKMSSAKPQVGLGAMENGFKYDLTGAMDKIKVPIRLIIADKFPYDIEAGKRHAVSFEVKVMKGVGHFLHMEAPDTFNKLLEETLEELVKDK